MTRNMFGLCSTVLVSTVLLSQPIAAFTAEEADMPEMHASGNLPIEMVGPDDLLAISVAECPDLTKSFRVSKDGKLALPFLKQPLLVDRLTPTQISGLLGTELVQQHILVHPIVSVQVIEYRTRMVTIVGAVKHPGQVDVAGHKTLLDVLSAAEGVLPDAGPTLILVSPHGTSRRVISVKDLLDSPTDDNNPVLTGGEEVRIPEAAKVYVMGNVKHPGAFPLHDGQSTSVFRILAECEGVLPFTNGTAYIYRQTDGGKHEEIPVKLNMLLSRKAPDVLLFGSDILYVPDEKTKRATAEVLSRLAQFGSNVSAQALIFH